MEANNRKLIYLPEPLLLFRHGQAMEDPRDGLTLFGPLDIASPLGVRAGVVGTEDGITAFLWIRKCLSHSLDRPATAAGRHLAR